MTPEYRSMIYVAMGTLHFYRGDITPAVHAHMAAHPFGAEQFIEEHPALVERIVAEGKNLFGYEVSHLQLCKAITAYFCKAQRVAEREPATMSDTIP